MFKILFNGWKQLIWLVTRAAETSAASISHQDIRILLVHFLAYGGPDNSVPDNLVPDNSVPDNSVLGQFGPGQFGTRTIRY